MVNQKQTQKKWGRIIRNERKIHSIMTPYQIDTYTLQLQQFIVFYYRTSDCSRNGKSVLFSQANINCNRRDVVNLFDVFNLPTKTCLSPALGRL